MQDHYLIQHHILTTKKLLNRSHEGEFRGIERWMMVIIMILKMCFPSFWIRHYADLQGHTMRNRLIEYYVLSTTTMMILILVLGGRSHWIWITITIYVFIDLIVYLFGLIILSKLNQSQPNIRRNLILLGINMIQIISAFAIMYLGSGSLYRAGTNIAVLSGLDAFYFSIATFATVGYGDMVTIGHLGHFIAICQIMTSFLFISLVLSSVVSKVEIHTEG